LYFIVCLKRTHDRKVHFIILRVDLCSEQGRCICLINTVLISILAQKGGNAAPAPSVPEK
jgi:hypothetical protein